MEKFKIPSPFISSKKKGETNKKACTPFDLSKKREKSF